MKRIAAAPFHDYPAGDGAVFGRGRRERIAALTALDPHAGHAGNFAERAPNLAEAEAIFATWGIPDLSDAELDRPPKLKAVVYAAGNLPGYFRVVWWSRSWPPCWRHGRT